MNLLFCPEMILVQGVFSLPWSKILKVAENDCTVKQGPATCFATVLRDKLLRLLCSVTAPLLNECVSECMHKWASKIIEGINKSELVDKWMSECVTVCQLNVVRESE